MSKQRYFFITVDTEGDNGWAYRDGDEVKTENSLSIPRFQELCEKYDLKPVYLTNYEMICDDRYVNYIKPKVEAGLCEVGIHIHAWNNPPFYRLERKFNGNPYLIEYPFDVMREKFAVTYNLIKERIGIAPVSHRAGRWVMNDDYFKLLEEYNILVDCSFTPGWTWGQTPGATVIGGSDYSHEKNTITKIGKVQEVPVTILKMRWGEGSLKRKVKYFIQGSYFWLRPATTSLNDMKRIIKCGDKLGYMEFMIHSSELMVGGSPYFKDEKSIEKLFENMERLFLFVRDKGYVGCSLKQFNSENKKNDF